MIQCASSSHSDLSFHVLSSFVVALGTEEVRKSRKAWHSMAQARHTHATVATSGGMTACVRLFRRSGKRVRNASYCRVVVEAHKGRRGGGEDYVLDSLYCTSLERCLLARRDGSRELRHDVLLCFS